MSPLKCIALLLSALVVSVSCQKQPEDENQNGSSSNPDSTRYLYIASGSCYVGGLTASSSAKTIARIDLATGNIHDVIVDYNTASPGDAPVGLVNADGNSLLALIENASGRRVDRVTKTSSGNAYQTYFTNATALNAVLRSMITAPDGALLISKSNSIEKFAAKTRVGTAPYVSAPAGACATTNVNITAVAVTPSFGHILYAHANTAPNNKIVAIKSTGYAVAGDCLNGTAISQTTAMPTGMVYIPSSNDILVTTGSTTAASNLVLSYPITETATTVSVGSQTVAYNNQSVIYGPSAIAYDAQTGYVYIANGSTSLANVIEKFTYDGTTKALTRVGSVPFAGAALQTGCITSMFVGN